MMAVKNLVRSGKLSKDLEKEKKKQFWEKFIDVNAGIDKFMVGYIDGLLEVDLDIQV